jgi:hypothetical protein
LVLLISLRAVLGAFLSYDCSESSWLIIRLATSGPP